MNAPNKAQASQNESSYCKFGAEAIVKLLTFFEEQIGGVTNSSDIEYVHRTRVTSRRLRAALPLFRLCFRKKEYRKWLCEIKKVTCLLGDARDLDVQIVFLEQYMSKLDSKAEKAGLEVLVKAHRDKRKSIQPSVVNGLDELKATDVLAELRKSCEKAIEKQENEPFFPEKVLEKARWNISFRLDDFLAMEKYVPLEDEVLKHHETRICAKKLRYTMESFASLYKDKLDKEIETIKAFQDVLGEMHDCDVWTEYIPKFIEETNAQIKLATKKKTGNFVEKGLLSFLSFVKENRKEYYAQFVNLWDENKKAGFFVQLRKTINAEFTSSDKAKIKKVLANPNLKIAVLADVHANLSALERVIEDAEEKDVDVFLNAGDSVGFGACPNEVVELLCEKKVLSVLGNYDLEVMEGKAKAKGEKNVALKFARKELAKSCEDYLYSLPRELRLEVPGKKLLVTHGSPESIEEHLYPDTSIEQLKTLAASAKADLVIVGHSHEQFWRTVNGTCFINPGSVGRSSDGNPQAAYAILTFNPFKVELVRLDYDVEGAAGSLRKKGLPESFAQMLLRGVSIDAIVKEDQERENQTAEHCKETVKACVAAAEKYWPDTEHFTQVSKLALDFFDGSVKLHHLGNRERCWLECASVLHDVGLSKSRVGHHKSSAKLILNDIQLPLTSKEKRIVANIARYHRKGLPKQNHYNLSTLDRETIRKVKILASMLRLADSLDYTHQLMAEKINVKVGSKRVTVECVFKTKSVLEEQAFNKKKDLFEKVFAKRVVLIWKQPSKPLDK